MRSPTRITALFFTVKSGAVYTESSVAAMMSEPACACPPIVRAIASVQYGSSDKDRRGLPNRMFTKNVALKGSESNATCSTLFLSCTVSGE